MNTIKKSQISFKSTGYFSSLMSDYLDGASQLRPFYKYVPDLASFKDVIADKQNEQIDRTLLANQLLAQYAGIDLDGNAVHQNIEKLRNDNTFTVTTGHQLGLFTGPLYFVYKIISTINLAESLSSQYPEKAFVPVFWMATEDHDFEEINHAHVFGKRFQWEKPHDGGVGRMNTTNVAEAIDQLTELAGDRAFAEELIALYRMAYLEGDNLATATRTIVHALFGQYGLVAIDGDDALLKAQMQPAFKDELIQNSSHAAIEKTNAILGEQYKLQVNPREINLFYLDKGIRHRITRQGERYIVLNNGERFNELVFSEAEILALLDSNPEKFSPNVVLRPLYQETILPNLAYIGGGGELAYWFQLKSVFEHHQVNFPMLLLRNSVLWIDNSTRKRLANLEISNEELFGDTDALVAAHVKTNASVDVSLEAQKAAVKDMFTSIEEKAAAVDPTLVGSVKAEQQKQLKSLENLESRMVKAEKRKQETSVNQIRSAKQKLFPNNSLQERFDNLSSFYLLHGQQFIQTLKEHLDVLDSRFILLEEQPD